MVFGSTPLPRHNLNVADRIASTKIRGARTESPNGRGRGADYPAPLPRPLGARLADQHEPKSRIKRTSCPYAGPPAQAADVAEQDCRVVTDQARVLVTHFGDK